MNLVAFGPRWYSPAVTGAHWVDTPVGETCGHCAEPFRAEDQGLYRHVMVVPGQVRVEAVHAGCDALPTVGHIYGVCVCTGWDTFTRAAGDELWSRLGQAPPEWIE
jgi:hypothetical protein